MRSKKDLIEKF